MTKKDKVIHPFCFEYIFLSSILNCGGNKDEKKIKGKLYFMARDAKSRMRNYNREKSIFNQIPYSKVSFNVYDQELYERVCKILSRDEIVINPIKELIDNKYYNTLSLEGKQKYIFDLSEKYKEMKIRYEQEHTLLSKMSII